MDVALAGDHRQWNVLAASRWGFASGQRFNNGLVDELREELLVCFGELLEVIPDPGDIAADVKDDDAVVDGMKGVNIWNHPHDAPHELHERAEVVEDAEDSGDA